MAVLLTSISGTQSALRRIVFSSTACLQLRSFSTFSQTVLRNIADALWYIRNADLHRDLQVEMVKNDMRKFAKKHEERILHHVNVEANQLLENIELV
jgi:hypothetical protein